MLREMTGRPAGGHASAYWVALFEAGLGRTGAAMESLEKACDSRDAWAVWLEVEPRFDSLRTDARVQSLLQGIRREIIASV